MSTRMEAWNHWEAVTKTTGIFGLFSNDDVSKEVELIEGSCHKNTALVVREVDFYPQENAGDHQTDDYDLVTEHNVPVLRRSQIFSLAIKFDQAFNTKSQQCRISFEFGPYPSKLENTVIELDVSNNSQTVSRNVDPESWNATLISNTDNIAVVQIQIGSKACVGMWKCKITTSEDGDQIMTYQCKGPLYIIFNPYDQDDSVFMPNQRQRVETVASDSGMVFCGSTETPWNFGQFDESILPACCFLLDNSHLSFSERGDPVKVSRAISSKVNSNDNNGIVAGRWDGIYEDGTAPFDWNGSVPIFDEYMKNKGSPVKYGQCWVFSAVVVTVCRALGLPCRSVTNVNSAHDTNKTLNIERFYDIDGQPEPGKAGGSVWNFHVWNDVWMQRPDLASKKDYGGWQAIDATPQEESDGQYQCGPAPVEAVRRGDVTQGYDTPFVFAEVNADICDFIADPKSSWGYSRAVVNTYQVGSKLMTKAPGFNGCGIDIMSSYKPAEGSKAERCVLVRAQRENETPEKFTYLQAPEKADVTMKMEDIESVAFGNSYKITIAVENKSNETRTVNVALTSSSTMYNGTSGKLIKKAGGEFTLGPSKAYNLSLNVDPKDYEDKLMEYCIVTMHGIVRVKETNQLLSDSDDFMMVKPKLTIKVKDKVMLVGSRCEVEVGITNPLQVPLTDAVLTVTVSGCTVRVVVGKVDPSDGKPHVETLHVIPKKKARPGQILVATFSSNELVGLKGHAKVMVAKQF